MKVHLLFLALLLLANSTLGNAAELSHRQADQVTPASAPAATLELSGAKFLADGSFQFQADWAGQSNLWIQSSTDLENWTHEALLGTDAGMITFTDPNPSGAHRFYRARDYLLRIHGTVRHITAELPVPDATVTLSGRNWKRNIVTKTDAQGRYHFAVPPDDYVEITVEKELYEVLKTACRFVPQGLDYHIPLWLVPLGYTPPNNDFQNRFTIEGTNVTISARTFAATPEPERPTYIPLYDYGLYYPRDLWWTWTAPMDGAVLIEIDEAPVPSGMIVYTGDSLQELAGLWATSSAGDAFFVTKGVQYQIAFGTEWQTAAEFNLKMVAPVPPFDVRARPGDGFLFGKTNLVLGESLTLFVEARGTGPLGYQWLKDGVQIPNATNQLLFISSRDLGLDDTGAYSVLVSNQVGAVVSEEIAVTVLREMPHLPDVMRGTWKQESSLGSFIITFTETQFSATSASDGSFVGSGHYRISATGWPREYHLVMNYTDPVPEVVHDYMYQGNRTYNGFIIQPDGTSTPIHGRFTPMQQP